MLSGFGLDHIGLDIIADKLVFDMCQFNYHT